MPGREQTGEGNKIVNGDRRAGECMERGVNREIERERGMRYISRTWEGGGEERGREKGEDGGVAKKEREGVGERKREGEGGREWEGRWKTKKRIVKERERERNREKQRVGDREYSQYVNVKGMTKD